MVNNPPSGKFTARDYQINLN